LVFLPGVAEQQNSEIFAVVTTVAFDQLKHDLLNSSPIFENSYFTHNKTFGFRPFCDHILKCRHTHN
jgi:hypothetical protein